MIPVTHSDESQPTSHSSGVMYPMATFNSGNVDGLIEHHHRSRMILIIGSAPTRSAPDVIPKWAQYNIRYD